MTRPFIECSLHTANRTFDLYMDVQDVWLSVCNECRCALMLSMRLHVMRQKYWTRCQVLDSI